MKKSPEVPLRIDTLDKGLLEMRRLFVKILDAGGTVSMALETEYYGKDKPIEGQYLLKFSYPATGPPRKV